MPETTLTLDDFAKHLNYSTIPADLQPTMQRIFNASQAIIYPQITLGTLNEFQQSALDTAILIVGQDLWRRKDSIGGAYLFADGSDMTGWLPRDQLVSVAPMLIESGLMSPAVIA